jgi:5-methylcytosine-specific restriction protein A
VPIREEEQRRRSGIRVAHLPDGMLRWIITMDPESAGFLTAALDARTAPRREPRFAAHDDPLENDPAAHDERTLARRRLDALVSMASESLRHDPGNVAGTAVTMLVTVSLDALRTRLGAAGIAGIDAPISAATARRLAAQAEIVPVVLGGASEPLDLGRSARLFSASQRRALALRDGGCVWWGCTAPPGWCEIAHVDPWARGGPTDLENAILLCPFHHRRFDLDGWTLEAADGERWLVPPSWVDARRTPRRARRARPTGDVAA